MIFPLRLAPGDTVALVAPSSPTPPEQAEAARLALEELGFRVRMGRSVFSSEPRGYAAAPARVRAEDLNRAFADPSVRGIWCLRGGSASIHLLPLLDYRLIARNPKVFVGFSDITNLHTAFQQRCGLVTYHGPMAGMMPDLERFDDFTRRSLFAALEMGDCLCPENPPGEPVTGLRPGRAGGPLTGGNLTLVAATLGTPYQIDARGRVLFLEDVDEQVYRIDHMLHQLKYAGVLEQAAGLVFGDFARCENRYAPDYGVYELLRDFLADYSKPVLWGVKAGHCSPALTLPLGAMCTIDGDRGTLRFTRGCG